MTTKLQAFQKRLAVNKLLGDRASCYWCNYSDLHDMDIRLPINDQRLGISCRKRRLPYSAIADRKIDEYISEHELLEGATCNLFTGEPKRA